MAQLVRVPRSHRGGQWFESTNDHLKCFGKFNFMGIEYLAGIQPGQKIDLSGFKNKAENNLTKDSVLESYLPFLKKTLESIAGKNNADFSGFLNADNRISIDGREAEGDKKLVSAQKEAFRTDVRKTEEDWTRDTEKDASNLTEIALTILLDKYLGDDFIVARSSEYDDYNNGVDQVIIYKPTGEVVCGFDEVIGKDGNDGGEKKKKKLENIMAKGGARVKYGAKLENNKLVRSEIKNVPAFFMGISKKELGMLLKSLKDNPDKKNETENEIFSKLLTSLESQVDNQAIDGQLKTKTDLMLRKFREATNAQEMN